MPNSSCLVRQGRSFSCGETVFCNFHPRFLALLESKSLELFRGKDPFCNDPELVRHLGEEICSQWREDWISFFLFLVQCRWFRRGWVVQEVVLRSLDNVDQVVMLCGSLSILWIDLSGFLAHLTTLDWRAILTKRLRYHEITKAWGIHFSHMLQPAKALFSVGHLVKAYSLGQTTTFLKRRFGGSMASNERTYNIFFDIVTILRLQKFSDKRDIFYGFLGLLAAVLPPGTNSPIRADYNFSVADILTKEVWHMLSNMSYLDVLSATQQNVPSSDLPSWVPDFSLAFPGAPLQGIRQMYRLIQFDASMTKSPRSLFRLTGGGLTLVSTRVVDITMGGNPLNSHTIEFNSLETPLEMLLGEQRIYVLGSEPRDEALCRTLLADTFPATLNEAEYSSVFREWWTAALGRHIRLFSSEGEGDDEYIIELLQELGGDWDWLPSIDEVLDAPDNGNDLKRSPLEMVIHRLWPRRALFQNEAGHFGLGPTSLEVMDEVWLLKGGRTPFFLRKRSSGNDYHFIGEAYVHGLMYGEAVTPALDQQMGPVTIF